MRSVGLVVCVAGLLVGACAGPAVVADSRGPFDTVSGLYGGNEFSPLSAEGKRTFAGEAPDKNAPTAPSPAAARQAAPVPALATAPMAAKMPAAAAPPSAPAMVVAEAAPMAAAAEVTAARSIAIDPNAFGAIFPSGNSAVKPTGEQLMQLDNLALIAAEPLRTDLQKKILACRRAADACRLAPR